MREHYDCLGLHVGASAREIRSAYRRLARRYHPDVNLDPDAAERFKRVHTAYQVLSAEAHGPDAWHRPSSRVGPAWDPSARPFVPMPWWPLMSLAPAVAFAAMWSFWAAALAGVSGAGARHQQAGR